MRIAPRGLGVGLGVSPRPGGRGVSTVVDMADVRPLRELLTDLVGDAGAGPGGPEAYLAEHGHTDLPPELVAEAVVNFADTASPEVAEQLAPFVTAHTSGDETATDWFDLLTSAPLGDNTLDDAEAPWPGEDFAQGTDPGLDFGAGAVDALDAPSPSLEAEEAPVDWPNETEQTPTETEAADETTPEVLMAMDLDEDVDEEPLD